MYSLNIKIQTSQLLSYVIRKYVYYKFEDSDRLTRLSGISSSFMHNIQDIEFTFYLENGVYFQRKSDVSK